MKESVHKGHRERMRNRFLKEGPAGFADHELLEMILYGVFSRGDTNALAHKLLEEFGSLSNLLDAEPGEIAKVDGFGLSSGVYLGVIHEVIHRYQTEKNRLTEKAVIASPQRAVAAVKGILSRCRVEQFYIICLDSGRRIIQQVKISEGTVMEATVYPRKVMEAALRHRASAVLLCHNHPGGNPRPSNADIALTATLKEILEAVGISVVDHIIVTENSYFSFLESNMLKKEK